MKSAARSSLILCLGIVSTSTTLAYSSIPVPLEVRIDRAAAICRGRVVHRDGFQNPNNHRIFTRTWIEVDEPLKGRFSQFFSVVHRGGVVNGRGVFDSAAPRLRPGDERVFFVGAASDGSLYIQGGNAGVPVVLREREAIRKSLSDNLARSTEVLLSRIRSRVPNPEESGLDLTSFASSPPNRESVLHPASGLFVEPSGASRRFTAGDRGEPIEYLVDADAFPTGISRLQAVESVAAAFEVWSEVTSLKFAFAGFESFGRAASDSDLQDGRIRIQLHDLYGSIQDPEQLGAGGSEIWISSLFPNGGMGGKVKEVEFFPVTQGYVSVRHTHEALANLATFEEVLCHEIGHVLGMAHASENQDETDPILRDAMMFQFAHRDGRGARLGEYDPPIVQQAYPRENTPPYGYDRAMRAVTTPGSEPSLPGINQIEFRSYDLQTDNLTITLSAGQTTGGGDFALVENIVRFTPNGFFNAPALDPSESWYERAHVRISDGTNASPYYEVNVFAMQPDQNPQGAPDGLPDSWVAEHFGHAAATVNPNGDADNDGISNADEFRAGTNPVDALDSLRFTSMTATNLSWRTTPYDLYEVLATPDLRNWFRFGNPVRAAAAVSTMRIRSDTNRTSTFFRVQRVP